MPSPTLLSTSGQVRFGFALASVVVDLPIHMTSGLVRFGFALASVVVDLPPARPGTRGSPVPGLAGGHVNQSHRRVDESVGEGKAKPKPLLEVEQVLISVPPSPGGEEVLGEELKARVWDEAV